MRWEVARGLMAMKSDREMRPKMKVQREQSLVSQISWALGYLVTHRWGSIPFSHLVKPK